MSEPKSSKSPAAHRRRVIRDLAVVADSVPTAYVESPLEMTLARASRVVDTELAYIEKRQREPNGVGFVDAKTLLNLVSTLEKAVNISAALSDKQLSGMTEDELEAALVADLERIRAKKAKRT